MSMLLLQPHQDDAVLFASFTLLHHQPHVVTVLSSDLQEQRGTGITNEMRVAEDECAMSILEWPSMAQWPFSDANPDWGAVENALRLLDERDEWERVFAPAPEDGGHDQHNAVGNLAQDVFGARVTGYLTYRRGYGRSRSENEVAFEPHWPALKLKAMACYLSQIAERSTREWFLQLDLREFYA